MEVNDKIRKLRNEFNVSQKKVADSTGLSERNYQKLEYGHN